MSVDNVSDNYDRREKQSGKKSGENQIRFLGDYKANSYTWKTKLINLNKYTNDSGIVHCVCDACRVGRSPLSSCSKSGTLSQIVQALRGFLASESPGLRSQEEELEPGAPGPQREEICQS